MESEPKGLISIVQYAIIPYALLSYKVASRLFVSLSVGWLLSPVLFIRANLHLFVFLRVVLFFLSLYHRMDKRTRTRK
jgi:hypothetical protein